MLSNQMPPQDKWKLLFSTLLNTPVNELDFQIRLENDDIFISTFQPEKLQKLQTILNSPAAVHANLQYRLVESNQPPTQPHTNYPKSLTVEHGQGLAIFKKIFGEVTISEIGFSVKWKGEINRADCYVLEASYENTTAYDRLTKPQIETYQDLLSSASFSELRTALAEDPTNYIPIPLKTDKKGILAPHIQNIFYIKDDAENNKKIYFDFGLLVSCLSAPEFKVHSMENQATTVKVNKVNLINYLSILFEEGFLLHITGDANAESQQGYPILFNMKRTIPVDNVISLVLDCSSSMNACWNQYIGQVIQFLKTLAKDDNLKDASIRITTFNSKVSETQLFSLTFFDAIGIFLLNLKPSGGTRLKGALGQVLTELAQFQDHNVVTLVFTDGGDNRPGLKFEAGAENLRSQKNPPKIYALGLKGGLDFNPEILKQLAANTGADYIELNSITEFSRIYEHIDQMGKSRSLAQFVQEITQFVVPAYANELSISSEALRIPGNFTVCEKEFSVSKQIPASLQPPASQKSKEAEPPISKRPLLSFSWFSNTKAEGDVAEQRKYCTIS